MSIRFLWANSANVKTLSVWVSLLFIFQLATAAEPVIKQSSPDSLIKSITQEVMTLLQKDPSISKDINRIAQLVDQKILPYADIRLTTQLTMGRHWRNASEEQKNALTAQFKDLLFYTYSGAISQIRDQRIVYKPFSAKPGGKDVVVQTAVINRGQAINIHYRLRKTEAGWKVYDINIGDVWLIQTYRQQFDEQISKNGIDGLLKFLLARNQQLKSGKPS